MILEAIYSTYIDAFKSYKVDSKSCFITFLCDLIKSKHERDKIM